jgi:tRNA (guanine-N7-)-methyltransferase
LRKIDPRIDLTRHLKAFEDLPRPWNAEALYGRKASVEAEVGSGKGLFLRTAAASHPDVDFLGIEVAPRYARFAAARLAQEGLRNAVVVIADAVRVFAEILPDDCLAAVHIYFPDPWWKRRHKKRRVLREGFVRDIERTLQPGGVLHYWTDVEQYFQTGLSLICAETRLAGPLDVPEAPAQADLDYRTHFERRMRLGGQKVYRAEFRK